MRYYIAFAISMGITISPVWIGLQEYPEWYCFVALGIGFTCYMATLFLMIRSWNSAELQRPQPHLAWLHRTRAGIRSFCSGL